MSSGCRPLRELRYILRRSTREPGQRDPQDRTTTDGMAWAEHTEPTPRDDPGRGPHHHHCPCRQRSRSERLQVRPTVRSLARPRPQSTLIRRKGSSRAYIEYGQRLFAQVSGCRRHLGDQTRRDQPNSNRRLGQIAFRAYTDTSRHRSHRQQDNPNRVGAAREGGSLQGHTGHLNKLRMCGARYRLENAIGWLSQQ
jgi:hypothetical protein